MAYRTTIIVHGGAGRLARNKTQYPGRLRYENGIREALTCGQSILQRGGSALKAVTEAVKILEDNSLYNAGKGAALCSDGSVELSASIMDGRRLKTGAMVGMKRTKNPILAARAFIQRQHGLLFGAAADEFAESHGLTMVPSEYFFTPERKKQWMRHRDKDEAILDHSVDEDDPHGTVGAVALDAEGHLAAGTSTGGLVNQLRGRVGDTPIVGAGTWADNQVCAISATGKGDAFARIAFARRLADLVELTNLSIVDAATRAIQELESIGGIGGCILVDPNGHAVMEFNSPEMIRGYVIDNLAPEVFILADETRTFLRP